MKWVNPETGNKIKAESFFEQSPPKLRVDNVYRCKVRMGLVDGESLYEHINFHDINNHQDYNGDYLP